VQIPVARLKGRQTLEHAKHELSAAFGQLQLPSGPPLGVRGLEGVSIGHNLQFGWSPYQPCKQQVLPTGQLKFSCLSHDLSKNKNIITIIIITIINKYNYIYI
jgi:hypothetical protein